MGSSNPPKPSAQQDDEVYETRPTVKYAAKVGLQAGIVGTIVSTLQNALGKHNYGAMGVFTRTGGTIGLFAAMGASFAFTESFVANTRQRSDALNGVAGGCAAGFLAGVRSRSLPIAVGSCAILGGAMGVFDAAGNLAGRRGAAETLEAAQERRRRFFKDPVSESA